MVKKDRSFSVSSQIWRFSRQTIVGGKVVYAAKEFSKLAPPPLPVSPDWSPVKTHDGYWRPGLHSSQSLRTSHAIVSAKPVGRACHAAWNPWWFGCGCFV